MKYHRPSHRDLPLWITQTPDFAPRETKRSGLFDLVGNIVGVFCLFAGLLAIIVIGHYAPDTSLLDLLRAWL